MIALDQNKKKLIYKKDLLIKNKNLIIINKSNHSQYVFKQKWRTKTLTMNKISMSYKERLKKYKDKLRRIYKLKDSSKSKIK
jgi:hypothetical protein